jgi:hypothetical protein
MARLCIETLSPQTGVTAWKIISGIDTGSGDGKPELKAMKPNGSNSRAKIIGEQGFVRDDEGIDDAQAADLQPIVHIFAE